jgi:hypothetical protein
LPEAVAELHAALTVANDIGHTFLQNQCLTSLTTLYRLQGDRRLVKLHLEQVGQLMPRLTSTFYLGAAYANQAWLNFRAGELKAAQSEAHQAVALWGQGSYPFKWLAYWILLASALQQQALSEAVAAARVMLDPSQHQLPDDIATLLEAAVRASRTGLADPSQAHLTQVVNLAYQYGYL